MMVNSDSLTLLLLVTVCWFGDVKGERYLILVDIVNTLIMVHYTLITLTSSTPVVFDLLPSEPVRGHQSLPLQHHQHSQAVTQTDLREPP